MRCVRYAVAASLDAQIARPGGEYDWILMDPAIDFAEFYKPFDTVLMGRRTFEVALSQGEQAAPPGMRAYVFSRTIDARKHPDVTVSADAAATVAELRNGPGKDIWLMGGGELFRSLLDAGLVDTVEVAVMPTLLGQGIPLLPPIPKTTPLRLTGLKRYDSGIVSLQYAVSRS